jgi:hypothetical protein
MTELEMADAGGGLLRSCRSNAFIAGAVDV